MIAQFYHINEVSDRLAGKWIVAVSTDNFDKHIVSSVCETKSDAEALVTTLNRHYHPEWFVDNVSRETEEFRTEDVECKVLSYDK